MSLVSCTWNIHQRLYFVSILLCLKEDTEEEVQEEIDPNEEEDAKKKHLDKKRKLKELFDAEYDEGESTYFDDLKGEMHKQAQVREFTSCKLNFLAVVGNMQLCICFCSLNYFCASLWDS